MSRPYYLVQRLRHRPLEGSITNQLGYGRLGDYELDYMGSAEFEWGAIPEAYDRLAKAKNICMTPGWEFQGHQLDFIYRDEDGEPFELWEKWATGKDIPDGYGGTYDDEPFYGQEPPRELERRLAGEDETPWRQADIWWGLSENVLWAFTEENQTGHLHKLIESLQRTGAVTLRG